LLVNKYYITKIIGLEKKMGKKKKELNKLIRRGVITQEESSTMMLLCTRVFDPNLSL
jgi:hypothetical protein